MLISLLARPRGILTAQSATKGSAFGIRCLWKGGRNFSRKTWIGFGCRRGVRRASRREVRPENISSD